VFARLDRLHPQAHLTELDRHRVDVDAVDASTDHVAKCMLNFARAWLVLAGTNCRQPLGHTSRSRDEEVARATGRIADLQIEDGSFGIGSLAGFVEERSER